MHSDYKQVEINTQGGMSYKEIVMLHFQNIARLFNCEFRGGFYRTFTTNKGDEMQIYVEDTRERLCNSILGFALLLKPRFDKKMKRKFIILKIKEKELKKQFLKETSIEEKTVLGENYYEVTNDKVLLEQYKHQKLDLYIGLFEELSILMSKLKYLEMVGGTF